MATLTVLEPPFAVYSYNTGDQSTAPAAAGRLTNVQYTEDGSDPDAGSDATRFLYQGAYQADGHIFHVWGNDNWDEAWIKSYTAPADSPGWPATYDKRPTLDPSLPNPVEAALHDAASWGHADAVTALHEAGVDVDTKDGDGNTPLHYAGSGGDADAVTTLHRAARTGDVEAVTTLLKAGADVNAEDEDGRTALHWAALNGDVKAIAALLDAKADVKAQDDTGSTPLHWAAYKGHAKAIAALHKAGAVVNAEDEDGRTPLHLAAAEGYTKAVTALLDADADVNAEDEDGRTPLHLAAAGGYTKAVTALLDADADVDAKDKDGWTPLHLAVDANHTKVVAILKTAGATVSNPPCFMAGTRIATPAGICLVENLGIGDAILTASGKVIAVKWIGRRSYYPRVQRDPRIEPVCIRAGALGNSLPHSDLTVTADHGMILGDMVIHASALVNGSTIAFVPLDDLPDRVTYYHIETEAHEVILANGAAAETFVDVLTRAAFDNYAEYLNLYGVERMIPEMDRLRVTAHRLLTAQARQQLGIAAPAPATAPETPEVPETPEPAE